MKNVLDNVEKAKADFRTLIEASEIANNGLEREQYIRYLQMQYHLVKDVQRQFYQIAGHPEIYSNRKLSEFLIGFGTEEGPHYKMAERDLADLDAPLGTPPLDVKLWWNYFGNLIPSKPLVRLGGTCVLENVGSAVGDLIDLAISKSSFLTPKNTTFLILHKHEVVNHGEQVLEAIANAKLSDEQLSDICLGIAESEVMFQRMFHWVLKGQNLK